MRDNWKVWQNYLFVCMTTGEFQQAMLAFSEILQLDPTKLDFEVRIIFFSSEINNRIYLHTSIYLNYVVLYRKTK
jgi:hypothetical protein